MRCLKETWERLFGRGDKEGEMLAPRRGSADQSWICMNSIAAVVDSKSIYSH